MESMVFRGAIARFGNSQGIRLPVDILQQANLYEDFAKVPGGKILVDLVVTPDSITIKRTLEEEVIEREKKEKYAKLMAAAAKDSSFLKRTLDAQKDFTLIDSEVGGAW